MDTEVDGEEVLLKNGELGARKRFVGYDTVDEGLEELGAEEGSIAGGGGELMGWR